MIPLVSIIICTFNRKATLDRCLESLVNQDADPSRFEVLVVDNNSYDGTAAHIARWLHAQPNFRYVLEPVQGLSVARNRGAREARAPYLTYVDDDALVPAAFVTRLCEVINRHDPDIIGGPIFPYYTSSKPRWFRDRYEIRQYSDASGFSMSCGVSGSNFTIRRELVEQLGGFDVALGMKGEQQRFGEERALLLAYRRRIPLAQQRVFYAVECPVLHWVAPHKLRFLYMVRRQFEGGLMNVRIANRATTTLEAVTEFGRAPWAAARYVLRRFREHGIWRTDYVEILLYASFHAGVFVAILRELPARLRTLTGNRGRSVEPAVPDRR